MSNSVAPTVAMADDSSTSSELSSLLPSFLKEIELDGHFTVGGDLSEYATDFGGLCHYLPGAVLHPGSVVDIVRTIERVFCAGRPGELTIAPQGRGHSVRGQGQTPGGIVVRMEELQRPMVVHAAANGEEAYMEVSGGALWIDVLKEGLKHGLAPKSWTAYLHVTVAGSLVYAGVGGQTFRQGPQISNVRQLEIVTGKGELLNCSPELNSDLFYAALGGLGQFGIITGVAIPLEPAPKMVKWIRLLYTDVAAYAADAESIILLPDDGSATFDFQEGFINVNKVGLLKYWMTSFPFVPKDPAGAEQFVSDGKVLYCLEVAKYFDPEKNINAVNEEVEALLSKLSYIPSTRLETEVPYTVFLERVHKAELKLRAMNIWEVLHPWLNLLVPRSGIQAFGNGVFGKIITSTEDGTLTLYPVNKSKWDDRTSAVFPDEDVFYLVGFLSGALDDESLKVATERNARIVEFCEKEGIGMKAYLPQYTNQEQWKAHFGPKWEKFEQRKREYDPLAILAPGQRIFNEI